MAHHPAFCSGDRCQECRRQEAWEAILEGDPGWDYWEALGDHVDQSIAEEDPESLPSRISGGMVPFDA